MELFSIQSGSSGNCIVTGTDTTHIMIDAGISGKKIEDGMNQMGYSSADMDAIFITHEHSDHVAGLGVIARKYHLPIYGTFGTIETALKTKSLGKIDPELIHYISPDTDTVIGDLKIHSIRVSHDAADPVAYRVSSGDKSVAVLTDLGFYNDYIVDAMQGLDAILIEANHDKKMLEVGPYPYQLKMRILSDRGHLSNETSGQLLDHLLHDKMKHVLLGHLSNENNFPDLALQTVKSEISLSDSPYMASDFDITVAPRHQVSKRIVV